MLSTGLNNTLRFGFKFASDDKAHSPQVVTVQELRSRRAQLNDQFLSAVVVAKPDNGFVAELATRGLMLSLVTETNDRKQSFQSEMMYRRLTCGIMDRIAEQLQSLSARFNALSAEEFTLTCTKPALVTEMPPNRLEALSGESVKDSTYYRARISSRDWSLVIRSQHNIIEFLLLPASRVIGLSKSESSYRPIARLQVNVRANKVCIESNGGEMNLEQLKLTCQQVFASLVERSLTPGALHPRNSCSELTAMKLEDKKMSQDFQPSVVQPVAPLDDPGAVSALFASLREQLEPNAGPGKGNEGAFALHFLTVQEIVASTVSVAAQAVEESIKAGMEAFSERDFARVEKARVQAVSRSVSLQTARTLEKNLQEIPWVCKESNQVSDELNQTRFAGVPFEVRTQLLVDSLDAIMDCFAQTGANAFARRDFNEVKRICEKSAQMLEFRCKSQAIMQEMSAQLSAW